MRFKVKAINMGNPEFSLPVLEQLNNTEEYEVGYDENGVLIKDYLAKSYPHLIQLITQKQN